MASIKFTPIETALLESAPMQGSGLHRWLIVGARLCERAAVSPDHAFDAIAETVVARGGQVIEHEIRKAIERAYSTTLNGRNYTPKPKWPEPDLDLIESITLEAIDREPDQLSILERLSPEPRDLTTQQIVRCVDRCWHGRGIDRGLPTAYGYRQVTPVRVHRSKSDAREVWPDTDRKRSWTVSVQCFAPSILGVRVRFRGDRQEQSAYALDSACPTLAFAWSVTAKRNGSDHHANDGARSTNDGHIQRQQESTRLALLPG